MGNLLKETDEWMRRRIRMVFWKRLEESENEIPEFGEAGN